MGAAASMSAAQIVLNHHELKKQLEECRSTNIPTEVLPQVIPSFATKKFDTGRNMGMILNTT